MEKVYNLKVYNLLAAPLNLKFHDTLELEPEELKRLCHELHTLLFVLNVESITGFSGCQEQVKTPYRKYFAFAPAVCFIAKEKIEETPQEAQ